MSEPHLERRILLLAPTLRDAEMSVTLLSNAGIDSFVCNSIDEICEEAERHAGAVVITAESVLADRQNRLRQFANSQPTWSHLPIIVLTEAGPDSRAITAALHAVGNVTLVKRPVQISTFLSTVQAAIRDRERQYQAREHLAERERLLKSLRDNDQRKDEFLAMLGHELRNPLSAIANAVEILKLDPGGKHAEWCLAISDKQIKHLTRMIDDLLDVSRITRGKIQLRQESLSLFQVLSSAIATTRPIFQGRAHRLEVELGVDSVHLRGDSTRLEQVFVNLLNNAAKYTERGGVIRLKAAVEGDTAVIEIQDTGIGMTPELIERAFELFAQEDTSSARSEGGLGLGLTLVRRLLELHGGSVSAASEGPGKGSTFTVRLPIEQSAPPEEVANGARNGSTSAKILVVEKSADEGRQLGRALRMLGHEVSLAKDGEDALQLAKRSKPDYVLLDFALPEMSECKLADRMRNEVSPASVIIAISTNRANPESISGSIAHRLCRPIDINKLSELVTR